MNFYWSWLIRRIHYWGTTIIIVPLIIVIFTGILLQFKKHSSWVQPKTMKGQGEKPTISFDYILEIAKNVQETEIKNWRDIDRVDVRPENGVIKIRAKNRWELQIDLQTGEILQVAYRRSDLIESIHDGSFFHGNVKLWFFFPMALILFILWLSGIYLFVFPFLKKKNLKS